MRKKMYAMIVGTAFQVAAAGPLLLYGNLALAENIAMQTKADHEKIAAMYEAEAKQLEGKIAMHEGMANVYKSGGTKAPNAGVIYHCKDVIKSYKNAIDDNLELAKHHHEMAATLK